MANIYPNSDPLSSVFVPYSFEPKLRSTANNSLELGKDYDLQFDTLGRQSIIKLKTSPYLDLYYYDHNRKKWYYLDIYGNRFSVYKIGDWIIDQDIIYTSKGTPGGVREFMAVGIDLNEILYKTGDNYPWGSYKLSKYPIVKYSPITITVNSETVVDKTDYSANQTVNISLDEIRPDRNKQFYYDFNNTIYSNQDFGSYSPADVVISYYVNIDKLSVKFRMDTNSTALSNRTPIVDYYILKLTGQTL